MIMSHCSTVPPDLHSAIQSPANPAIYFVYKLDVKCRLFKPFRAAAVSKARAAVSKPRATGNRKTIYGAKKKEHWLIINFGLQFYGYMFYSYQSSRSSISSLARLVCER